jgi:hypothetical protein
MSALLIGSNALRHYGIGIERANLDVDLIATMDSIKEIIARAPQKFSKIQHSEDANHVYLFPSEKGGMIYDIEIAWLDSVGDQLLDIVLNNGLYKTTEDGFYAVSPGVVLALKVSHKYKKNSKHFLKTMRDIQLLKSLGYKIPKCLSEWMKERKAWTYNYKHPKLDGATKKDFFSDDGIKYVYDHDSIHVAVKHLDQPAYRYFQPEGEEVATSKEEFFAQPERVRLHAVLEESYVLSLERAIIPFDLKTFDQRKKAFDTALEKVCTSITSGWFRKYAWDNFDKINDMYNQEYVDRFWCEVESNNVKPFDPEAKSAY